MKEKDINSLDHTSWRCQYHIVFAPKYRRQVIYREIKVDIGKILRKLCDQKGVEIIEAELCPDHVQRITNNGIPQRKKFADDFRQTCKFKVQVRKSTLLGKRLLRRYSRSQQKAGAGIHKAPVRRRPSNRPNEPKRVHRPVYGQREQEGVRKTP